PFFTDGSKPLSVQALDIAGQRFDVLVAELGSDGPHDRHLSVVGAIALTEIGQLLGGIGRMLATQVGERSKLDAYAVRRMATGAGRHAQFQLAAAVESFTQFDQGRIGHADRDLLAGEVGSDIFQVLVAVGVEHAGHFQHLATYAFGSTGRAAGLDVLHLLEQIGLALSGKFGEVRCRAVAIGAVAGSTNCNSALTGFGVSSRVGHTGDAKGQQQTHEYFVHQLIQLRLRVERETSSAAGSSGYGALVMLAWQYGLERRQSLPKELKHWSQDAHFRPKRTQNLRHYILATVKRK